MLLDFSLKMFSCLFIHGWFFTNYNAENNISIQLSLIYAYNNANIMESISKFNYTTKLYEAIGGKELIFNYDYYRYVLLYKVFPIDYVSIQGGFVHNTCSLSGNFLPLWYHVNWGIDLKVFLFWVFFLYWNTLVWIKNCIQLSYRYSYLFVYSQKCFSCVIQNVYHSLTNIFCVVKL